MSLSNKFWKSYPGGHLFYLAGWCAKAFPSLIPTLCCYYKPKFPFLEGAGFRTGNTTYWSWTRTTGQTLTFLLRWSLLVPLTDRGNEMRKKNLGLQVFIKRLVRLLRVFKTLSAEVYIVFVKQGWLLFTFSHYMKIFVIFKSCQIRKWTQFICQNEHWVFGPLSMHGQWMKLILFSV